MSVQESAQEQLSAQSRAFNYGQDVSQLYEREDECKPWRAEEPATPEEKEEAAAVLRRFLEQFDLTGVTLNKVYEEHVAHLESKIEDGPNHLRTRAK